MLPSRQYLEEYKTTSLCEKCPNTWKWGPEKTPYLDTFHAVHSPNSMKML